MPKGAPKGNQYARKATRRRGLTVSYYVSADILEFLRECLDFEIGKSDDEAVRERVHALTKDAIGAEMRRVMSLYALHKSSGVSPS